MPASRSPSATAARPDGVDDSPRRLKLSSTVRGVVIGALIAGYAWLTHEPQAPFSAGLIIGAALQLAVLLVRRFVPAGEAPRVIDVCEMLADGATVLLFALGVLGPLVRMPAAL
jgi:hypothetical protein